MWYDNLKKMKEQSGMTTKEIARQSGIPEPTLEKLFSGATKDPKLPTMQKLVHFFGRTLDDLDDTPTTNKKAPPYSSEACKLAEDFDKKLDDWGKRAVRGLADNEIARCQAEAAARAVPPGEEKVVQFRTPRYMMPMSAGTGQEARQEAGQEYPEDYTLVKAPPRGTSYIAPVDGVSMEPTYRDGDLVFVHACEGIRIGEIGVFFMDGRQWIKELGDGVLISHNPAYPPRPMTEDVRCQGLVLGICDKSYFE